MALQTWITIGAVTAPALLAFLWHVYAFRLRPLLIPASEITALADALVARHGEDAEEMAFIEEDSAWRRSDIHGQGRWRRVRRALHRRGAAP